jgi:phosphate transport system permease protein
MHEPHAADSPLPSSRGAAPRPAAAMEWSERLMVPALRLGAGLLVLLFVALVAGIVGGAWSWVEGSAMLVWSSVVGTLAVTGLAMVLAVPVGVAAATFLAELASPGLRRWLEPAFELLAGLPALALAWLVVAVLGPAHAVLVPGLALPGALGAALVLALMIVPTVASLSVVALRAVPRELRLSALALGATPARMLQVVVPAAAPGLVSAALVAVSRAMGETLLVTLAVGHVPARGLDPRAAVASLVAADRADAAVGVPALLCVVMVLYAWGIWLRRRHERRRDG